MEFWMLDAVGLGDGMTGKTRENTNTHTHTNVTATGIVITCYISFPAITFPYFLPYSLSSPICYRMIRRGRRLAPSPKNNKHTWANVQLALHHILHFTWPHQNTGSRDSSVGIATGYVQDDRGAGVRVPLGSRNFFPSRRPDRFWGPPRFLSNGYRGLFPRR
jgi:hypothetical protein